MARAVAVLQEMWDWRSRTTSAGYKELAPPYYRINPRNFSGKRLYDWIGPRGEVFDELLVTNACKELVSGPNERGTPDPKWLKKNIDSLKPFDLLLVCGKVAQQTCCCTWGYPARTIYLPHPAARNWTKTALATAGRHIREGTQDLEMSIVNGRLQVTTLIPF